MAKGKSVKNKIIDLIKKHPKMKSKELYKLRDFDTVYQYFIIIYNEYKYSVYPQTIENLRKKSPNLVKWIEKEYETTNLTIKSIAELYDVEELYVKHIKNTLGIIKEYSPANEIAYDIHNPKEKPSLNLSVGDIINVTKHNPVDLRDIFVLGKSKVVFQNKHYTAIQDANGQVHGFNNVILHKHIEYEKVST